VRVELAVEPHGRADVARIDRRSLLDESGDPSRLLVVTDDLGLDAVVGDVVVDRDALIDQHPLDQVADLRKRLRGRILELLLECLPLGLPFVAVEAWIPHAHSVPRFRLP
jgi:hypothetical protein